MRIQAEFQHAEDDDGPFLVQTTLFRHGQRGAPAAVSKGEVGVLLRVLLPYASDAETDPSVIFEVIVRGPNAKAALDRANPIGSARPWARSAVVRARCSRPG